jgi:hypothetical protein
VTTDSWSVTDDGIESEDGRLFIGNPNDEYTITVNATYDADNNGLDRGYGIFFDTKYKEDGTRDIGHILQFDRYYSGLKIEKRNQSESSWGGYDSVIFDSSDSDYIPDKSDPWWTESHEITMDVNVIDAESNTKTLSVKIDGHEVITNYEFESDVTAAENQTGFRSWGEETLYEDLTITGKE